MESSSFAHRLAISGALPRLQAGMASTVNIGFLAPLSGPVESWGLPGLHGCRIWENWLNAAGGLLIDGRRYPIRIHAHDCGYEPKTAMAGAVRLVQDHDVKLLMMLGGDSFTPVADFLMDRRILTSTLLPSDLSPDTPYLIAPSEVHPIYLVTGVEWLAKARPELKTVAMCSQRDALGLPSLATYRAAFKAAGIRVAKEIQYDPAMTDAAALVQPMLEENPDILCWCTSYTPMVHAMTEYAHAQGFRGQIISCTLDHYDRLVARTGRDFMEGTVFHFPDFDDPALREKAFFFNQPNVFYEEYNARYPGSWSAVSWEYAAILDIWHAAVEKAGTVNPLSVLAAMKQLGHVTHAFGPAQWWGRDVFGVDNALVGEWPVVTVQDGKARIVSFGSVPGWLRDNADLLKREMIALGQMWDQRLERGAGEGTELQARNIEA
ncbi:amino acid/amide ABC transporter substrate-binding protein, HAAT family [Roseovarius litoreus]|jgi:branched-chain amino acid transport system substrate-binding protein|uniref:Amino acid/amide ABC transporter substrate-binding protein, HAAT family n=1 Tax=Roseovarius litoreus TaxID=1155722 RepID=A0A1M7FNC2_9RHOB|nr:ABC transporter substrate-binding protein [Roseovarius litoreus]SHM05513.1 amino acid/amide ABC transporter substrate-binding protein, HAAT family [Roseovarius litoreus]